MLQNPHIGIITQVRMTSTRLPGKIIKKINHKSLLQYHIERLQQADLDIAIATTSNASDDGICEFAETQNIKYHRGSEMNVLSRFHETAIKYKFDIIVRVTSDCPLIDARLIRNSVEKYLGFNNPYLYLSNVVERTFARGFDFEVFSFELLDKAFQNAVTESDLEHVTPYIWKNHSGMVTLYNIKQAENNSNFRITVDTQEDFEVIKVLIEKYNADKLSYREIEKILNQHSEIVAINAHIEQKKV